MALPQPDPGDQLRQAVLADARSSLAVTEALIKLLDDDVQLPVPRLRIVR